MPTQHKCIVCKSNITPKIHRGLDCVVCNNWYHQKCANLTVEAFDDYRSKSIRWSCINCLKKGRRSSFIIPQTQKPSQLATTTPSTSTARNDIPNIEREILELRDFKRTISDKIEFLENTLRQQREIISEQNTKINNLSLELQESYNKINNIESSVVRNTIEIRGLPESSLKQDPTETVLKVASEFDFDIRLDDFHCKIDSPVITVEFKSAFICQQFISSGKKFNREKKKFCNKCKIFVNNKLTTEEKKLLYLTKKFASEYGYKFAWHTNGHVHLKQNESTHPIIIKNKQELDKIKTSSNLLSEHERAENENGGSSQSNQL